MRTGRRFLATEDLKSSGYSALVLERLVKHVCRVAGVDRACILVRDKADPRALIAAAAHGAPLEFVGSRVGADEGILGRVMSTGEPLLVEDCDCLAEPVAPGFADDAARAAFAPIHCQGIVDGLLMVAVAARDAQIGAAQIELLTELGEMAGAALEHAHGSDSDREAATAHVRALAAAMDLRDRSTAEHSEDVVLLAGMVGRLLQLEPAALVELEFAARLHDVGKIRVPDSVLNKPGPLNADERRLMRQHPGWGCDALADVPGLEVVATIVRFHHERWDGNGYPDGLEGPRIPLASRIIAVCDAFGAMTCDRPYRAGMGIRAAVEELRACAGSQFDPAVVSAFCEAVAVRAQARRS